MNRESGIGKFISLAFGSDEVSPYSAEYSWNSNQMAHIMMGFCLASCWIIAAMTWRRLAQTGEFDPNKDGPWKRWLLCIAKRFARLKLDYSVSILFLLIPIKELLDMWLDSTSFGNSPVDPNWERLRFDAITDIAHWWLGMFLAALIVGTVSGFFQGLACIYRPVIAGIGFATCLIFLIVWARPMWQEQKRVFDRSDLPGTYTRLVVLANGHQGGLTFAPSSKIRWNELEEFRAAVVNAKDRPVPRHYIIFGGVPRDRTRLAVAMGCEHAFKIRDVDKQTEVDQPFRIRYVTATTLLERLKLADQMLNHPYLECVVIDDLDVSTPLPTSDSPKEYLETLNKRAQADPDRKPVMSKRVLDRFKLATDDRVAVNPKTGLVELDRTAIENLQKQESAKAGPWIPSDSIEVKRQEVLIDVGKRAKDKDISTIWVLAGRTEGMSPELLLRWQERRTKWIEQIGVLLDLDKSELRIIELAAPPNEK